MTRSSRNHMLAFQLQNDILNKRQEVQCTFLACTLGCPKLELTLINSRISRYLLSKETMGDVEAALMEAFLEDCDSEVFSNPDCSVLCLIRKTATAIAAD